MLRKMKRERRIGRRREEDIIESLVLYCKTCDEQEAGRERETQRGEVDGNLSTMRRCWEQMHFLTLDAYGFRGNHIDILLFHTPTQ